MFTGCFGRNISPFAFDMLFEGSYFGVVEWQKIDFAPCFESGKMDAFFTKLPENAGNIKVLFFICTLVADP